jgi:ssDNA-binding Zn-finger/Zn-ribbon topoisomerase 1
VANLTFLDEKLPSGAILRGMLHDMQGRGRIVDAKDILALRPILDDLQRFGRSAELDVQALQTGLFSGKDFDIVAGHDMSTAEQSIVIFSGFVTRDRVAALGDLLRERIARGVKVRCVTRPPARNGTIPEEQAKEALDILEEVGAVVDLRADIHEKAVVVDGKIAWFGSLNPLSHTSRTSEMMTRVDDEGFAGSLADFLSLKRGSADASDPHRTSPENPRCDDCSGRAVFRRGKFGLYYTCESCDWKRDFSGSTRTKTRVSTGGGRKPKQLAKSAGKCPKCGAPLVLRNGRFGEFYGCSTYPKCDARPAKAPAKK